MQVTLTLTDEEHDALKAKPAVAVKAACERITDAIRRHIRVRFTRFESQSYAFGCGDRIDVTAEGLNGIPGHLSTDLRHELERRHRMGLDSAPAREAMLNHCWVNLADLFKCLDDIEQKACEEVK